MIRHNNAGVGFGMLMPMRVKHALSPVPVV
jgi:hypothetical protein